MSTFPCDCWGEIIQFFQYSQTLTKVIQVNKEIYNLVQYRRSEICKNLRFHLTRNKDIVDGLGIVGKSNYVYKIVTSSKIIGRHQNKHQKFINFIKRFPNAKLELQIVEKFSSKQDFPMNLENKIVSVDFYRDCFFCKWLTNLRALERVSFRDVLYCTEVFPQIYKVKKLYFISSKLGVNRYTYSKKRFTKKKKAEKKTDPGVKELSFLNTRIEDSGNLRYCRNLEKLKIHNTDSNVLFLDLIKNNRNISEFSVNVDNDFLFFKTKIWDFLNVDKLKVLEIEKIHEGITDKKLNLFYNLNRLVLSYSSLITNEGLKNLTNLRSISIINCTKITVETFKYLRKLEHVVIDSTYFSKKFFDYCNKIQDLEVRIFKEENKNFLERFDNYTIKTLIIRKLTHSFIGDDIPFFSFHKLEKLILDRIHFSDTCLNNLKINTLEWNCSISPSQYQNFVPSCIKQLSISPKNLKQLKLSKLKELKYLSIDCRNITSIKGTILKEIESIESLKEIEFIGYNGNEKQAIKTLQKLKKRILQVALILDNTIIYIKNN